MQHGISRRGTLEDEGRPHKSKRNRQGVWSFWERWIAERINRTQGKWDPPKFSLLGGLGGDAGQAYLYQRWLYDKTRETV